MTGPVIAGNHNVVVDAQHGSRVTVLVGPERPARSGGSRPPYCPEPGGAGGPGGRDAGAGGGRPRGRAGAAVGPPGVGKTTLLRHAARLLPPGPDGTVFLGGARRDVEDLAQDVFECCYEAPATRRPGPSCVG
ncbi:hypothetical protein NKH77_17300 [Streptomyces sp. M19]